MMECVDPRAFGEECHSRSFLSIDKEICSVGRCFLFMTSEEGCTGVDSVSNSTTGGCEGLGESGIC
ncbi:hypothetical protein A3Q56_02149 [Intoshia linei]|uniref:Uncharacterized protein n=1 Tax=Intoshia linei TaxID=1819745 RepID=A0A177B715_9BILA|nr:hypothetical protein A3Q56_02149 [Intoshia linei]